MGLPAWFSTLLLAACAQALWKLADVDAHGARSRWSRHERVLALIFVLLSIDELTEIHEQTITPLRSLFGLGGALTFAWVVLAIPAVVLLGLLYLGYLRSLPVGVARLVVLSAVMYVGGAVGVELVGSALWSTVGTETPAYTLVSTLEEVLEMLGLVLFLGVITSFRLKAEASHGLDRS